MRFFSKLKKMNLEGHNFLQNIHNPLDETFFLCLVINEYYANNVYE